MRKWLIVLALAASPAWAETNVLSFPASLGQSPAEVQPAPPAAPSREGVGQEFISAAPDMSRLHVGTRATYHWLRDSRKETFLGHITELDVKNNLLPNKLYADWSFTPDWGVGVSLDQLRAKAWNQMQSADDVRSSDGSFVLNGITGEMIWRFRSESPWTPYAGIGLTLFLADFDHETWWRMGYGGPEVWKSLGKPSGVYKGKMRKLDPENSVGYVLSAGCKRRLADRWSLDLGLRYTKVDVDTHYTITLGRAVEDKGITTIPMDFVTIGAGIEYAF